MDNLGFGVTLSTSFLACFIDQINPGHTSAPTFTDTYLSFRRSIFEERNE